jgi:hypothetical protein
MHTSADSASSFIFSTAFVFSRFSTSLISFYLTFLFPCNAHARRLTRRFV